MNEGWFKIHRCLFKNALWLNSTPEQKVIMITLMGMANHESNEWEWNGKQYKVKTGEFVTSAKSIMEKTGIGISRQNVRTALTRFKKHDFLTYESNSTGMLIRIVNWALYQGEDIEDNHAANQKVTKGSRSTKKSEKNNEDDKKYKYIHEFTKNTRLIETIMDFLKMRKEIKKPMTDRAVEVLLNKLKTLSQDEEMQIKILENSIQNCWQGIFKIQESGNSSEVNNLGKRIGNGIYSGDMPRVANGNVKGFFIKGDRYGNFGENNGSSEKKFNIKVPKWEPEAAKGGPTGDEPF